MRLTLRTLLAYMDGLLEPADAEEIGKRIEASPVASDLLRRARDVMRRLRLKAPDVDERGTGLDPNTVAEYLDHMLPDDRVPDFERVCLESDMHLAEVAACHQILALVLGEPADVDPASREHMYQLPQVADEQVAMRAGEMAAAQEMPGEEAVEPLAVEPVGPARRPKPVVPDYLREQPRRKRRVLPTALAILLVVCLAVVALALSGQLERWGIGLGPRVARESEEPTPGDVSPPSPIEPPIGPAVLPPDKPPAEPAPVAQPEAAASTAPAVPAPSGAGPSSAGLPEPVGPAAPIGPIQPPAVAVPPATPPGTPPPSGVSASPGPVAPGPGASPPEPPVESAAPTAQAPPVPGAALGTPPGGPVPPGVEPVVPVPTAPGGAPPDEPGPTVPTPPEGIGRFVSDGDLLLSFDAGAKEWKRVPGQGILTPHRDLLALPTYRPLVALANGTTLHLIGGTQVRLLPADEHGMLGVDVGFGRLVVGTVGRPGATLSLSIAGRRGVLTLVDAESTLAVAVTRPYTPGADPEAAAAEPLVEFYAAAGRLRWEEPGAAPLALTAPAKWMPGGPGPQALAAGQRLPEWIASDAVDTLYRRPSFELAQALKTDRPIVLAMQEMTTDRRKEMVWLAIRCLGYVGEFGPMVKVLNDRERKLEWADHVDELRAAQARGPGVAGQVRAGMEAVYGPPGAALARMLHGYTNEQLAARADAELVGYLDHETLAFRVLAFANLREITGAGLYYRPEDPPTKRQQPIRSWQQRRLAGDIRWQTPPKTGAAKPTETPPAGGPPAKTPPLPPPALPGPP